MHVDLEAAKHKIGAAQVDDVPSFGEVLKSGWHFLVPIAFLIVDADLAANLPDPDRAGRDLLDRHPDRAVRRSSAIAATRSDRASMVARHPR